MTSTAGVQTVGTNKTAVHPTIRSLAVISTALNTAALRSNLRGLGLQIHSRPFASIRGQEPRFGTFMGLMLFEAIAPYVVSYNGESISAANSR